MIIDKKNMLVFDAQGNQLPLKTKLAIDCLVCKNEYKTSMYSERRKKVSWRCRSCANRVNSHTASLIHNFDQDSLVIDKKLFMVSDSSGNKAPVKMHIFVECDSCFSSYQTTIQFEKRKKHTWRCASCAIKLEWKDERYRDRHCESLSAAARMPEARARSSRVSKRNWMNPEIRKRMLDRDYVAAARKGKETLRNNLLSGKTVLKPIHGNREWYRGTCMRSSYEVRFARYCDSKGLAWKYEPKHFLLKSGKIYLPDFYLENFDLWVEIKGWWRDDALEKFNDFVSEHALSYALLMKEELDGLESGELTLETCIKKARRQ